MQNKNKKKTRNNDNDNNNDNERHNIAAWGIAPPSRPLYTHRNTPPATRLSLADGGTEPTPAPRRVNRFQTGLYDRPIVLIGCRGAGDELTRLAESIVSQSRAPSSPVETGAVDGGDRTELSKGTVVKAVGTDGGGSPWVMTHERMRVAMEAGAIDRSSVVVLDFDAAALGEGGEAVEELAELARALYEDEGLLAVYVNVDPEDGGMSEAGAKTRARLEESVFRQSSDYELCIRDEGTTETETAWSSTEWQLQRILARAALPAPIPGSQQPSTNTAHLTMGRHTFFLSLSFPSAPDVEPYAAALCRDVDAMELRVDLLTCRDDPFQVLYDMQKVRQLCRPHAIRAPVLPGPNGSVLSDVIPVVYTVRTAHQAGTYPDDPPGISKMFDLLHLGLRAGVEVLDVESAWDPSRTDALLRSTQQRYSSQILGSHHVVNTPVSTDTAVDLFRACALDGRADATKVVLSMEEGGDDHQASDAGDIARALAHRDGRPVVPHIGVILGEVGQYSRTLNLDFTPVTHEALPVAAAPGQLSAKELMYNRGLVGLSPQLRFGILGSGISYSVSPAMQGGGFEAAGLPHSFEIVDRESVEEIVDGEFWKDSYFGGCCVTIPHKQAIIPHVDRLTNAAEEIGAVNTVIVSKDRKGNLLTGKNGERVLIGDNTDWKGIFHPLDRLLGGTEHSETTNGVALILGGGGTARAAAYAASRLNLDRVYYNRTPSKARELAARFGGTVVRSLDDSNDDGPGDPDLGAVLRIGGAPLRVVISTLPAAAEFTLPDWVVQRGRGGDDPMVVFDVNYKPYCTELLRQAEREGFPIVRGSEMLWEQGVEQFELWTGRTAPYRVMKDVVLKNCLPEEEKKE